MEEESLTNRVKELEKNIQILKKETTEFYADLMSQIQHIMKDLRNQAS